MAKITIGEGTDNSQRTIRAEISSSSNMELHVGETRQMARLDVEIIERNASSIEEEVRRLLAHAEELRLLKRQDPAAARASDEAVEISEVAKRIVRERKWFDVSITGLMEAAKAVGSAASPLLASAVKVVELLGKAKV